MKLVKKESLKKLVHKIGVEVFMLDNLPFGVDRFRDVERTGRMNHPSVIFDVGANIGQTSLLLRAAFRRSLIYAFEPVSSTYQELLKNTHRRNIRAFNLGFAERKARQKIFLQPSSGHNSLVEELNKQVQSTAGAEEVQLTTLDTFCKENAIDRISLLKIDTEGYGMRILRGALNMLRRGCIEWILIEVGFHNGDLRHDNYCEVSRMLGAHSFRLFGFYDQWIEHAGIQYCNALFLRR